jgi:hypothetical protein
MGCGKTWLATTVDQQLRHEAKPKDRFAACYFSNASTTISTQSVMYSLISQLGMRGKLHPALHALCQDLKKKPSVVTPTTQQMKDILTKVLNPHDAEGGTYIIVDALDEIPFLAMHGERAKIARLFNTLASLQVPTLRVLMTSRPHEDLLTIFRGSQSIWRELKITVSFIQADIRLYVGAKITQLAEDLEIDEITQQRLIARLAGPEQTMWVNYWKLPRIWIRLMIYRFRLAALQLASLQSKRLLVASDVETVLESLPHDLNAMYDKILQEDIHESHRPLALKVLRWLAVSYRPLEVEEISEACTIPPESELERATMLGRDRLTPKQLLNLLPNLVVLDSSKPAMVYLAFAHFSVREYLTGSQLLEFTSAYFRIQMKDAHRLVAKECLAYLYLSKIDDTWRDAALEGYSRKHWHLHAVTTGELDESTRTKASILLATILSGNEEMLDKNHPKSFIRVTQWLNEPERISLLVSILRHNPYPPSRIDDLKLAILYPQAERCHTITPPAILCNAHRVPLWFVPPFETIVYDKAWSSDSMRAVSMNGCPLPVSHSALQILRHISQGSATARLLWLEEVCGSAGGFGIFELDADGTHLDDYGFSKAERVLVYLFGKLEKAEPERHRSSSSSYQILTSDHWLSSHEDCHLTALEDLLFSDYRIAVWLCRSREVVFLYNFYELSLDAIRESLRQHRGSTSLPQGGAFRQVVTTIGPPDGALPASTDLPDNIHRHPDHHTFPKTRALMMELDDK